MSYRYVRWGSEGKFAMTFQILALSGGGYRGLFTARVLSRLEAKAGRPLRECFDLISGTSIGGIIAIGLAMGKSAESIEKKFTEKGEDIFPHGETPPWWTGGKIRTIARQMFGPKYDGKELRTTIEAIVGAETLIKAAGTRLLIPSVNMTKGSVQMFKTAHNPKLVSDKDRKAVDVAMATSAAPFFFPMAEIDDAYFLDGGVVANAPDFCAIHEALNYLNQKIEDISVLSIGTTTTGFSLPSSLGKNLGIWKWIWKQRFSSTVFSAQQQLVHFLLTQQLGDRYLRIDAIPSNEQCDDLGLDLATESRRKTLLGMAEGAYQNVSSNQRLTVMLGHQPTKIDFYN